MSEQPENGSDEQDAESADIDLDTAIGPVSVEHQQIAPTPQRFETVPDEFAANVVTLAEQAGPEFVQHYLPETDNPQLRHYDEAFGSWLDDSESPFAAEAVIWILGSVFGQTCCKALNMDWTVVIDDYGTDFAIRHQSVELLAFPFSTVAKRVEDRSRGFLVDIFYVLDDRVKSADYASR